MNKLSTMLFQVVTVEQCCNNMLTILFIVGCTTLFTPVDINLEQVVDFLNFYACNELSTHLKFTTTWSTKQLKLFFYRSYSHCVTMGNKKSSGYAKKRKLSGNQFQNTAKKLRISDQSETSEANTSASARKISARISTEHKESIKESVWLSFS